MAGTALRRFVEATEPVAASSADLVEEAVRHGKMVAGWDIPYEIHETLRLYTQAVSLEYIGISLKYHWHVIGRIGFSAIGFSGMIAYSYHFKS